MTAAKTACEEMGVEYVEKTQVPESNACYDAAVELVEVDKCDIIFADSYGHEQFMIMAAKEYPETEFCHASGVMAHTEKLDNYHNAYASIYEGRYLTGVVAGMKLNEMIEEGEITAEWVKMGYVGTFTFAEVISAYTSFYLGAKSVCPSVTMEVMFTGSMYDETKEKEAANALIEGGCVLISQYSESLGAPIACENAGIPNIAYNGSTKDVCPETFLVSSRIDWTPYFKYIIDCVKNGEDIFFDWTGSLLTGSVILSEINTKAAAEGTAEKLEDIKNDLITGNLQVFDTDNFTVGGERLDSFMADVDMDFNYTPDTEVIENGVFYESKYRSAPYFVIEIDGINLLDRNYG
ncbi:MAG: BMP family ABC transporter substrate-binding protein [Ruminococcaceae bacterium]|nr:BMP family ABC transporter substrate-binding protein [Oscillospiraceae bacterium]